MSISNVKMPPLILRHLMELIFLKSKLHQACVTHVEVDYDGSCAIDVALLEVAGIAEYEQIDIYNMSSGERLTTYAIAAERGSKIISMNGATARKACVGDRVIICCYCRLSTDEALCHRPQLIYLDENNTVVRIARSTPVQAA